MSHSEYDTSPLRGIPGPLPPGETLIWQGAPAWRSLAVRAFHVRKIAIYFALIWLVFAATDVATGTALAALRTGFWLLLPAVLAILVLSALAWLYARMTVYSITSERLVIHSGIALPMTVNIPFAVIETADFKNHGEGTGDLPVCVMRGQNTSYVVLWPNVRPRRFARPQPMLRCVPEPDRVAAILAAALTDHAEPAEALPAVEKTPRAESQTQPGRERQRAIA